MNFCILIELSKKKISFLYNRSDGESKFTPFVGEGSALPLAIYCLGNDMQIGQFAIDEAMKQITNILGSIDNTLKSILEQVTGIRDDMNTNHEEYMNAKQEELTYLGKIYRTGKINSAYLRMMNSKMTSMNEKLANYLFKNVIVEPQGLTPDSFESMEDFNQVISFAREVMEGNFRDKKEQKPAKKTSKE